MRTTERFCAIVAILVANGWGCRTVHEQPGPPVTAQPKYGKVELLRDGWGVPHVFAQTDAGAMYGLGYATAQDRAFQMYYNLRIIQGQLAELVGDVRVGATRQQPEGRNSALRSDIEMRTIGYYRAAQEIAASLDAETKALLQAYSDGVNDYISNHPNDLLYLFNKLGLKPETWTPADCIASWWRLGLFFSGDGLNEAVAYYGITDGKRKIETLPVRDWPAAIRGVPVRDDAAVVQRSDVSDEWVKSLYAYADQHSLKRKVDVTPLPSRQPAGPRFSHAWVVGGKRSTDGSAVLVSDPQTQVRNPSLFYEFHVAGQTFNARGIGVAGSPIILIGFTKTIAWGMSALGADQADLFMLKTDPNHPNQYLFDGRWRDMEVHQETIYVKNGPSRTITYQRTHLGPVVTSIATGLRPGDEAALKRIPLCELGRDTFSGSLAMVRSRDVREFQRALGGWRFPSVNCIFADRAGNIGFKTALALPLRSAEALLEGFAAHVGWSSEVDWQGIVPDELLPQVINPKQGWLVTANHRPIASFYPIPLGISTGSGGDTDRSWRLKERLSQKEQFSLQDVLDVQYDTVAPVKRDLVRLGYHLRDVQKSPLGEDTLKALKYLESWRAAGSRSDMSIRGTEILNLMPMAFRQNFAAARTYGGGLSGLCNMLQTIDARLDRDPNAHLTDQEAEYVNTMLQAAWRYGVNSYGQDPNQWQQRAQQQLQQTRLGYFATLDGFGSLDPERDITTPPLRCIDGGTVLSQQAQSYTQAVPLADADKAMALLPIGESERPVSAHRLSGYGLWSKGNLRPAPLLRQAVEPFVVFREALRTE